MKGIWIPIEIWEASNLSWNEKILLMEIDSYTSKGKECYISNEFISHLLGVTERQASKYLSRLIELNYVKVVKFNGRQRFVESTLTYFQAEWNKSSRQSGTKVPHTYKENTYKSSIDIEDNSTTPAFDFKSSLIGLGVSQEVASEWMKVRRAKRAVNSDIALKAIEREIKKSGLSADAAIRIAVERSWSGFDASWILKEKSQPQRKKSVLENNIEVFDALFGTNEHARIFGQREDYDEQ